MKYFFTHQFTSAYHALPLSIQKKFDKQLEYLLLDIRHSSLRAKKYDETKGIWQARVDRKNRFFFLIEGEYYIFLTIGPHPK